MLNRMIFAVLFLVSTPAVAGPFGVSMGQSVTSLNGKKSMTDNSFKVVVPKPHAEFESYTVIATPLTGVCKIWGIGKDHDDDRSGEGVRSAYSRLKDLLDHKYGISEEYDFLKADALWNKSSEWVMAINKNERTLSSFWTIENKNSLVDGITSISLEVKAYSSDAAYLDLTYEFENFVRCKNQIQIKQSDAL